MLEHSVVESAVVVSAGRLFSAGQPSAGASPCQVVCEGRRCHCQPGARRRSSSPTSLFSMRLKTAKSLQKYCCEKTANARARNITSCWPASSSVLYHHSKERVAVLIELGG